MKKLISISLCIVLLLLCSAPAYAADDKADATFGAYQHVFIIGVDGAGRFKQVIHVTLPCIRATIITMFILQVGRIMTSGFEQIFYLQNGVVKNVSDILDTYIYSITFQGTPNFIVKWTTGSGMFS